MESVSHFVAEVDKFVMKLKQPRVSDKNNITMSDAVLQESGTRTRPKVK